jgi:monofunctional biosynthetic peptidoglycan transglycosylase
VQPETRPAPTPAAPRRGRLRRLLKPVVWLVCAAAVYVLGSCAWYLLFPDVAGLAKANPKTTAFMEYRLAQWKEQGRGMSVRQQWVPLSAISPALVSAVLIGEDDKFYAHEGFDFEAIAEALEKNLSKRRIAAGASTITQQLAKNLFLSPDKNPLRKLREAILTWRIERNLKKRRILEIYLNVAEWGDGIFGIEAASRKYYGKPARDLDARQAARLAAVLPNPIRFNPLGSSRFVEYRASVILKVMARRGVAGAGEDEGLAEWTREQPDPEGR